ncbi:hypothetical protein KB206_00915 [Microvirga sp. STS02]|uniref:glycoside hydrolase family 113 n=1 Tax=Hymenobacter negativus TaxID=2795026 RepID=UPI0018DB9772|nr:MULTISPECIES: hypothetical protein [Bacteria]MBH8567426.1 hypothetical protein [Hymenobacter negativus]MBR7207158.1 hypothetical protein [Microvirga sp. STS02]
MPVPAFSWRRLMAVLALGMVALFGLDKLMTCWLAYHSESGPVARAIDAEYAVAPSKNVTQPVFVVDSTLMRGVSWVGGDSIAAAELAPLLRDHVSWISQMPFGWQAGPAEPAVQLHTARPGGRFGLWGESDAGIDYTARLARAQGIRTLLKPHLWVRGRSTWPGDINMTSPAAWDAWFASYATFMLHYAALAEAAHLDGLCIGTELQHATEPAHEKAWRSLIRQIRRVYHGPLTYAANWSGEYEQIRFWDALDYVGIQAYFPLSAAASPPLDTLLRGWQLHLQKLARWQKKIKKPIVFTEVGYKTTPDAAARPWEWPERTAMLQTPDEAAQARCYEALFRACWGLPWLKGMFIWKWYPGLAADGPARRHADFTPQHKPAEAVLARWYGQ